MVFDIPDHGEFELTPNEVTKFCPLSWDSVDDRVEPCHNWRYTNEALKLINDEE